MEVVTLDDKYSLETGGAFRAAPAIGNGVAH
jgi:hypothetical protein